MIHIKVNFLPILWSQLKETYCDVIVLCSSWRKSGNLLRWPRREAIVLPRQSVAWNYSDAQAVGAGGWCRQRVSFHVCTVCCTLSFHQDGRLIVLNICVLQLSMAVFVTINSVYLMFSYCFVAVTFRVWLNRSRYLYIGELIFYVTLALIDISYWIHIL